MKEKSREEKLKALQLTLDKIKKDDVLQKDDFLQKSGRYYITKDNIGKYKLYDFGFIECLMDSLGLKNIIYQGRINGEEKNLKELEIEKTAGTEKLIKISELLHHFYNLHSYSQYGQKRFTDTKDVLIIKLMSVKNSEIRINIIKGLINFYSTEIKKGKSFYNLYYIELKRLLKEYSKEEETFLTNYSESKLTEKIIALNESGVLDYLRNKEPFNIENVNNLASFLSLCIGEKTSSIYSCINPMFKESNVQKNNPYKTKGTVGKVKQKLIQIGFKIK